LRGRGHHVCYPQLPDPDFPSVDRWLTVLREHLAEPRTGRYVVICHSLGCMAWLHLAARGSAYLPVDGLLFVAPPSPTYLAGWPAIVRFQPPAEHQRALAASSLHPPRLVCGDNDETCVGGADQAYPEISDVDVIPGGGHLDVEANYGEWPSLLNWCENPAVRIRAAHEPVVGPAGADNVVRPGRD
jgi:Predicted esterase of the alpha/beta hydrolase fold